MAFAVVAAFLIPITMCGIHAAKKPTSFPGDKVETRTCRECGGAGIERGDAMEGGPQPGMPKAGDPCIGCGGKGKVQVIIPGPNHPSMVRIKVYDAGAQMPTDPAAQFMMDRDPRQPIPGAIPASIEFSKDGKKITVTSMGTGRAKVRLAPGKWSYTARSKGFRDATGEYSVPVLTQEIWHEDANIIREEDIERTFANELLIPMER